MSKMKICQRQLQNTDVKARQDLGVWAQVMPVIKLPTCSQCILSNVCSLNSFIWDLNSQSLNSSMPQRSELRRILIIYNVLSFVIKLRNQRMFSK